MIDNETEELSEKEFGLRDVKDGWVFDFLVQDYSLYQKIKEENESYKQVDADGRKLYQIDVEFQTWKYVCCRKHS